MSTTLDPLVTALNDDAFSPASTSILRSAAKDLAGPAADKLRESFITHEHVVSCINEAWRRLECQPGFWLPADSDATDEAVAFGHALALLTRNAVAESISLQEALFHANVPIRRIVSTCSSFTRLTDTRYQPLIRAAVQAVSNLVTSNEELLQRLWDPFFVDEYAKPTFIRLLSSNDDGILVATCVFILNCIHSSPERTKLFVREPAGMQILSAMLERMDALLDDHSSRAFEIITSIVKQIIEAGEVTTAYHKLGTPSLAVSPSQLALLKILDAHLPPTPSPPTSASRHLHFLLVRHHVLSDRVTRLAPGSAARADVEPGEVAVWQSVVLASGMLERLSSVEVDGGAVGDGHMGNEEVEALTTRCMDLLKIAPSIFTADQPAPPPPRPSTTGLSRPSERPRSPLIHLQTSTLKLLSALCFGRSDRAVKAQDAVRGSCDGTGLGVVLGLTNIDEEAPFVREHALFLLRNLLLHNEANQRFVEGLQLQRRWVVSPDGELREL